MYSLLVDDSSEHKKEAKGVNKYVVVAVSHNEHEDVLLNCKCLSQLMHTIQNKTYRMRTYEIREISLSCIDDEIHILKKWI